MLDTILTERPSTGVLICGDFNNLILNTLCRRFNLQKLVKSPTRGKKILDQILTNMSDLFHGDKHLPPIGRSDHQCLLLTPKTKQRVPPFSKKVRLMKPVRELNHNGEYFKETKNGGDVLPDFPKKRSLQT